MADKYLIVQLRVNREKYPDVVTWIEGQPNKTQALIDLVQAAIADDKVTLNAIRRVVESVLDERGAMVIDGTDSQGGETITSEEAAKLDAMF